MPETDDKCNIEKYLKVHEWKKQDIDLNAYYWSHVHILHMKKNGKENCMACVDSLKKCVTAIHVPDSVLAACIVVNLT